METSFLTIDRERCIGCSACVRLCPTDTLALQENKAAVIGERCLHCDHCAACCPTQAIHLEGVDSQAFAFSTFEVAKHWLPFGGMDIAPFVHLMRSRRSCRQFQDKAVDRATLEDLVRIGCSAPSGTNSQTWAFTLLPDRSAVLALTKVIAAFFKRLNRIAAHPFIRHGLRLLGKPELHHYYERYFLTVQQTLQEWEAGGRERLFHAAPAVILISSQGGSTPGEDALLATQNILLAAHAMGLGTCLIGFAVAAMKRDRSIQEHLGIPHSETVHSVIALGHPDQRFERCAGRKMPTVRWWGQ